MNKEKMLELADFIESIPPKRFNISMWASEMHGANYDFYKSSQILDVNLCKTAGCIAGWAMALENDGVARIPEIKLPDDAKLMVLSGAEILGLEFHEATRLFYVDEQSIWVQCIDLYEHLLDCEESDLESARWSDDELACFLADYDVINNRAAGFMLRQIANGEVVL